MALVSYHQGLVKSPIESFMYGMKGTSFHKPRLSNHFLGLLEFHLILPGRCCFFLLSS